MTWPMTYLPQNSPNWPELWSTYLHMVHHLLDQMMMQLPPNGKPQPFARVSVKEEMNIVPLFHEISLNSASLWMFEVTFAVITAFFSSWWTALTIWLICIALKKEIKGKQFIYICNVPLRLVNFQKSYKAVCLEKYSWNRKKVNLLCACWFHR